jgi:inner membrane transporter RhtA
MVSLLPATATIVGIVVLAQIPSPVEVAGVALVVAGIAVHREPTESGEPTEARRSGGDPALATSD